MSPPPYSSLRGILKKDKEMKHEIDFVSFDDYSNQPLDQSCLEIFEDEPHLKDIYIGQRLGFSRPNDIRKIIERNIIELSSYGTLRHRVATEQSGCLQRKIKSYWLNEAQALLISMKSETPRSPTVRKELIDLYMAYRYQGTCLVKAHRRAITPPADTGKRDFAPRLDNLSVYQITDASITESARSGEIVVAAPVDEYAQSGLYTIRRMDGSTENFRCSISADGKEVIMAKDNTVNVIHRVPRKDFDRLDKQKIVAVFKCLDGATDGYGQLCRALFCPVKRSSKKLTAA